MTDGFRKALSKAEAEEAFEQHAKDKKWLACQFIPPSFFMHPCRILIPVSDVDDLYCVAETCRQCELRDACETLGQDEPYGVWGGVSRTKWSYNRRIYEGDWPYF